MKGTSEHYRLDRRQRLLHDGVPPVPNVLSEVRRRRTSVSRRVREDAGDSAVRMESRESGALPVGKYLQVTDNVKSQFRVVASELHKGK